MVKNPSHRNHKCNIELATRRYGHVRVKGVLSLCENGGSVLNHVVHKDGAESKRVALVGCRGRAESSRAGARARAEAEPSPAAVAQTAGQGAPQMRPQCSGSPDARHGRHGRGRRQPPGVPAVLSVHAAPYHQHGLAQVRHRHREPKQFRYTLPEPHPTRLCHGPSTPSSS